MTWGPKSLIHYHYHKPISRTRQTPNIPSLPLPLRHSTNTRRHHIKRPLGRHKLIILRRMAPSEIILGPLFIRTQRETNKDLLRSKSEIWFRLARTEFRGYAVIGAFEDAAWIVEVGERVDDAVFVAGSALAGGALVWV
jgi:hypothetical protein